MKEVPPYVFTLANSCATHWDRTVWRWNWSPDGCRPATTVAHFTVTPHLGTNVDAALAKLVAGTMNSGGSILGVGVPNPAPVSAKINMGVAKSGRTTGLTCGSVQSVNTSVKVQYQKGCN